MLGRDQGRILGEKTGSLHHDLETSASRLTHILRLRQAATWSFYNHSTPLLHWESKQYAFADVTHVATKCHVGVFAVTISSLTA